MPFGDKETDDDFHFFKIRKKDYVLFRRYNRYLRMNLRKNPNKNLLKCLNKLMGLIIPADLEKDVEQERKINEISKKVVRYFKEDGEYYFKPDKKRDISFEDMIYQVVSSLIFYDEINIIERNRDEWIMCAYTYLISYLQRYELKETEKISNYGLRAISCYVTICSGFSIGNKKITNPNLFQGTRNAFKPKKSGRRVKDK